MSLRGSLPDECDRQRRSRETRPKNDSRKQILKPHCATRSAGGSKLGEGDFRFAQAKRKSALLEEPAGFIEQG